MAIVGQLLVLINGSSAGLTATLAKSEAELKAFGTTAGSAGALASKALVGVGAVAALGIGLAIKAAADYEDAFAGVRKTVSDTDLSAAGLTFEDLSQQFRTMATQIPVAATELAGIGETAGALGIRAGDIESFTRTVALLGSTTNLSTDQAATSLGKIGTVLGLTGKGYTDFADILVNLGNKGASTETEIIDVAERFAAAGRAAGLSKEDILGFSSAIASAGVEPEAAGSSLSRLFSGMVLGTANATAAGKSFATLTGKSFTDFSGLVKTDTVGAMLLVLSSLKDLDKFGQAQALKAIGITNVRDVNAIRLLAQTYDTNLIPALDNARNSAGALGTEAEKRFATFNVQLELLGNNLTELAIGAGTPLLPALTGAVQGLTGALPALSGTVLPALGAMVALGGATLAVNVAIGALGLLLSPVAVTIAAIAASGIAIQGFLDKNNALAAAGQTPAQIAATKFFESSPQDQQAAIKHGYNPNYADYLSAHPALVGPRGPASPAGTGVSPALGAGTGFDLFDLAHRPGQPIQLTYTSNVHLDGALIAQNIDRHEYNTASTISSGFATEHGSTIR